ncbi:MAG: tetratricopeptide repeat protein [Desulfobacterales bacterium]|nr:tetratricopeptide repeat protein [Desulfobacterales bacterium]
MHSFWVRRFHWIEIIGLVFASVVVCLLYSNSMKGGFTFDDLGTIKQNEHIRISEFSWSGLKDAALMSPCKNRPVSNITFALNYYVHQYDVVGYHVVNLVFHLITGGLLFIFLKHLLRAVNISPYSFIPLVVTTVWMIHPIQTQSVSYIIQRMNIMASLFYVLALISYIRLRSSQQLKIRLVWLVVCILSGVLAFGSKEISATLPFFIVLYEWYFFQNLDTQWLRRHAYLIIMLILCIGVFIRLYFGANAIQIILVHYEMFHDKIAQRVLTQFRVLVYYLTLLLFPKASRLNLDYDFTPSLSLVDPLSTLLSLTFIISCLAYAFWIAKKYRWVSFCILWYFGNLFIESSFIRVEYVYEHRLYLPSMMVILLLVWVCSRINVKLATTILCIVIPLLCIWTFQRNHVWSDELLLWQDCVQKSPNKARPHYNLGIILDNRGQYREALPHFFEVLRLNPQYPDNSNAIAMTFLKLNQQKAAITYFKKAIDDNPSNMFAYNNLGAILTRSSDESTLNEGISYYQKVLSVYKNNLTTQFLAVIHNNLGLALERKGQLKDATEHYRKAIVIDPDLKESYYYLGAALSKLGELDKAITYYHKAIEQFPDYTDAYYDLGNLMLMRGDIENARIQYEKVLSLNPNMAQAHVNLGTIWQQQGDIAKSIEHYEHALKMNPNLSEARYNLGNIYASQKEWSKAFVQFKAIVEIQPDFKNTYYLLGVVSANQNKIEDAITYYQLFLQQQPEDMVTYIILGTLFVKKRDMDAAIHYLEQAIQLNPMIADSYNQLGIAYIGKHDYEKAMFNFSKALEISPDRQDVIRNLQIARQLNERQQ